MASVGWTALSKAGQASNGMIEAELS